MELDIERTALLLMDLQNDIVSETGKFGSNGSGAYIAEHGVLNRTAQLLAAARDAGAAVIHVAVAYRPGHPEVVDHVGLLAACKANDALVEGTWGAEFHPAVTPRDGEPIVTKRGLSSFASSDLDTLLAARGVDTLLLAGVATNLVVDSTARDAAERGLRAIVVGDCCAGMSPELHDACLQVLPAFAAVASLDEARAALGARAAVGNVS